jgi:peptide/nickel transport system ATP-binding protein
VLQLDEVDVYYDMNRSLADAIRRRPAPQVKAVSGVNLELGTGRTIGIVGESGSGKTSLARAIVALERRTGGEISLLGIDLPVELSDRSKHILRHLQYVFQNPEEALNPHMTVGETLSRPLLSLLDLPAEEVQAKVLELLEAVRLSASYTTRFPAQLSGGEKQRVAIARASATNPELLITDEPVSALDVSVQASILNLLRDLQIESRSSLLFISHDLAVVGYIADEIAVMYLGFILELSAASRLFDTPLHPYTEALVAAIPTLETGSHTQSQTLEGDVPSQLDLPGGCPFNTRCPRLIGDICRTEMPPWQLGLSGDRLRCHIPLEELAALQTMPASTSRSKPS